MMSCEKLNASASEAFNRKALRYFTNLAAPRDSSTLEQLPVWLPMKICKRVGSTPRSLLPHQGVPLKTILPHSRSFGTHFVVGGAQRRISGPGAWYGLVDGSFTSASVAAFIHSSELPSPLGVEAS